MELLGKGASAQLSQDQTSEPEGKFFRCTRRICRHTHVYMCTYKDIWHTHMNIHMNINTKTDKDLKINTNMNIRIYIYTYLYTNVPARTTLRQLTLHVS